uniref:Ig-like domain-containing protein n=1 Tax=Ciona savignyi TaxID=51511 RepID=H2Y8C9_CIOSA
MYFDWLGTEVPYTTYTASQEITSNGAMTTVAPVKNSGLVKMILSPAQAVPINSTIVAIASAEGAFPKPTFTWWGEDLGTTNQPRLTRRLEKSQVFFCLVENPVGRVVMSVEFTAANTDDPATIGEKDTSVGGNIDDPVMASGAVVAAIAFGGLLLLFLFAVLIYYFGCKRPTDRQLSRRSVVQDGDDFDDYVEKQKPMYGQTVSPYEETSEMKHKTSDRIEEMVTSHEKDALLTTGNNYEDSPCSTKKQPYSDSSSTSTSGFSDDENGRNFHERRSSSANSSKERAITKHLNDFDENASFCDDYGSRFGLDDVGSSKPSLVEVEARESPFDGSMNKAESEDFSDTSSVGSGDTVEERRYPITHHPDESWEHLDPMGRVQTPV